MDLRWINFKNSLQITTRNAEVAVCHPSRESSMFELLGSSPSNTSLTYKKIQIGVDVIAILGEVHWLPFQHQIIQSETLWKCWRVGLVIISPPEYNVHNIAGFFPHFSGGGDICGACGKWFTWYLMNSQPSRQRECWHSLHFPIRNSPGIVFIRLWGGWIGRERGKNITLWRR